MYSNKKTKEKDEEGRVMNKINQYKSTTKSTSEDKLKNIPILSIEQKSLDDAFKKLTEYGNILNIYFYI